MKRIDMLREKKDIIIQLSKARNENGKRYSYKEICEMLGLPTDDQFTTQMSHFLNNEGIRRKITYTIKKKETPVVEEEVLFKINPRRERFLLACEAFANIFFGEE